MSAPTDRTRLARRLRRRATPAERRVWKLVRNRGVLGLKFRRQKVLRGFIVDFYCAELGLVLEIDGPVHDSPGQGAYDSERDEVLRGMGLNVERVRNEEVGRDRLMQILARARNLGKRSPPSPDGRGDRG